MDTKEYSHLHDGIIYSVTNIPLEQYSIQYSYPSPIHSPNILSRETSTSMDTIFGRDSHDSQHRDTILPGLPKREWLSFCCCIWFMTVCLNRQPTKSKTVV